MMSQALAQLRGIVAEVTGSSSVGDEEPLMAAGLDSLAVVELRRQVEAAFGVALPATVALDYPTLKVNVLPAA
jgi:acyl carrier protein